MTDRMTIWERFKYRNGSKAHLAAIRGNIEALAADRDRARSIAVALEQQLAAIQGEVTAGQHDARDDWIRCTCWKRNVQAILDGATFEEVLDG